MPAEKNILQKIINSVKVRDAALNEAVDIAQEKATFSTVENTPIPLKTLAEVQADSARAKREGKA